MKFKNLTWFIIPTTLIIIVIVFFNLQAHVAFSQTRNDYWEKDINYLRKKLPKKHKNLFFKINKETFDLKFNSILYKIDHLKDIDIYIALQEVIALLGDDHTFIHNPKISESGIYPISLNWFSDGIYVINTIPEYENLLHKKIVALNKYPIQEVITKLLKTSTQTNNAVSKNHFLSYIQYKAILEYYDIVTSDSLLISYINENNELQQQYVNSIKPEKGEKIKTTGLGIEEKALCEQNKNKFYWYNYNDSSKILYAQYNKCINKRLLKKINHEIANEELGTFKQFTLELFNIMNTKPVEKFIFDMRYNPGGSSIQGTFFVKKLAKLDNINQYGKLFVVIGKKTFSSAIINALDFKNNTNAIFVGEPTGGKPNHFGEIKKFTLPNSGLVVYYSTKHFIHSQSDTDSFYPNYEINTSFNEYKNGVDPVYNWIKNFDVHH